MTPLNRGKGFAIACLLLILTVLNSSAATDVFFDVQTVFSVPPPFNTNRVFKIQALSPFSGNFFWKTSDVTGVFYVSNSLPTTYSGTMQAPPNSLTFSFYVSATNLGTIAAQGITSIPANGVQTFPAGQTAYSAQASDLRYAPSASGPSGSLSAPQSTNLTASAIPTNFWNTSPGAWLTNIIGQGSINTNRYAPGAFLTATTNSSGLITFNVSNLTNNFTSIATSNPAVFADTNLLFVTSNSLAGQIGSAGASLIQVTNIGSNQVWTATNNINPSSGVSAFVSTNRFDTNGAATAATNGLAITSGLSAFVSTNRFDTNGAANVVSNVVSTANISSTNSIGLASGYSAFVNTNRFVPATNGYSTNQNLFGAFLTNSYFGGNGLIALTNAASSEATPFFSHYDAGNGDSFIIGHGGGEFILGITNGSDRNYIDFNINGENEYANQGGVPAHRFYLGPPSGFLTNIFEVTYTGIRSVVASAPFVGNGSGLTNIPPAGISTNGSSANQVITSVGGKSVWTNVTAIVAAGITNAVGTNFPNGLLASQTLFYPTNFDTLGGSNILYLSKLGKTNDTSYGQIATNLVIEGNVGFGITGQATNILGATTNLVKFINAGTSVATNGVFIWQSSLGCYTNWITSAIWTNSGSSWLMSVAGASPIYTLAGSSPFGQSATGTGSLPAPLSVPTFFFDHNGMQDVGYFSVTNLNFIITNSIGTNTIASLNGFGTNTYLTNATLSWWGSPAIATFQVLKFGISQTISGSGNGVAILSGQSNNISLTGSAVIGGGTGNSINSSGLNFDAILGGVSNLVGASLASTVVGGQSNHVSSGDFNVISGGDNNVITSASHAEIAGGKNNVIGNNADYSSISGGFSNQVLGTSQLAQNAKGSAIIGGASNQISGSFSIAGGKNVVVSNDNVFAWSSGLPILSPTNDVVMFAATNGFYIYGGGLTLTNLNPGSATMALGVTANGTLTTNGVPGGGGGGSQTPIIQDVNFASFAVTNWGLARGTNALFYGGITNASLTATTLLESDANKKLTSLANAAGILTNNGSAFGFNPAPAFNLANGTNLPFTATDSSWPGVTNYVAATNQFWTAGQAVVVVGTNTFGSPLLKATNWPSGGGGGSQTPWTSDIDGAQFALTNINRMFMTNATGQFVLSSNQYMLSSNDVNTTYTRWSTNHGTHWGSNNVDTVSITPTDGNVSALTGTFGSATALGGASNTLAGTSWVSTNLAPYFTADSGSTTTYTTNTVYTGKPQRGLLVGSVMLNSGLSGNAGMILFYTNNNVGFALNMQVGSGVAQADFIPFCVPLSTNATFQFVPALGTGASCFITNTYEWLQ